MEGLDEQSSSLAPLPVADLLTHCDQILALRHYAHTTYVVHYALQHYAHTAYGVQRMHMLCIMHSALCTPAICTHCICWTTHA